MSAIEVWGEGRTNLWTPNGTVNVPDSYEYLPAGDAALTRAVKRIAGALPTYIVMEKVSKYYPARAVGIWAPTELIENERKRLGALRTDEHRTRLAGQREARQERDIEKFCESIQQSFPSCPIDEVRRIAEHACEVGTGRVGRSKTADDPVRAAVIAHIRHEHTNYEEILRQDAKYSMDRDERERIRYDARFQVRDQIDEILRQWETIAKVNDVPHCR